MAGITHPALAEFRRLLRSRGSSIEILADEIGYSRHNLSQVLNGHFAGADWWPRILAVVTEAERSLLFQLEHCATWNTWAEAQPLNARVFARAVRCHVCERVSAFEKTTRDARAERACICPDCFPAIAVDRELADPGDARGARISTARHLLGGLAQ